MSHGRDHGTYTGTDPECLQIRDLNLSKILSAGTRGDIVFFASLRMPRLAEQWVLFPYDKTLAVTRSADFAKGLAQSVAETEVDIEQLERAGFLVLFDLPKPVIPAPTFRCADWFNRDNPICAYGLTIERSKLETLREPVNAALSKIQMIHPQVVIWDPFPALCPGAICSAFDSAGKPLFRDGDHLSGHGNQVLYPSFRQFLLEQLS